MSDEKEKKEMNEEEKNKVIDEIIAEDSDGDFETEEDEIDRIADGN